MKVREVMRRASGLDEEATLADVAEAIQATGCEAVPLIANSNGGLVVSQLVTVRDLPNLRRIEASVERGHALGTTVRELLEALGRKSSRLPTIGPDATLADAWGVMSEGSIPHLPVVEDEEVIGLVSLVVTFAEFPHRSPAAGFWP
jgi:signal-transduction protein with cAMP-binding, CBS, and nucleotidyltransferase domain